MAIEITLLINITSVLFSIFLGVKNNKRTDAKEVAERVAENTKLNIKMDEAIKNTAEIKEEVRMQRQEVQALAERTAKVEASASQAHKRIDEHIHAHTEP